MTLYTLTEKDRITLEQLRIHPKPVRDLTEHEKFLLVISSRIRPSLEHHPRGDGSLRLVTPPIGIELLGDSYRIFIRAL